MPSAISRRGSAPSTYRCALFCTRAWPTLVLLALLILLSHTSLASLDGDVDVYGSQRIAHMTLVGCNRQESDQSFWLSSVAHTLAQEWRRTPHAGSRAMTDVLMWTGAATYATIFDAGLQVSDTPRSVSDIQGKYAQLRNNTFYKSFVQNIVETPVKALVQSESPTAAASPAGARERPGAGMVLGVMDDQDLGQRGASQSYPQTAGIKAAYMDLLNAPESVRRQSADHDGVYYVSTIPTEADDPLFPFFVNRLCTITLDVRTQRHPVKKTTNEALLHAFEFYYAEEKRSAERRARRDARGASRQEGDEDEEDGMEVPMDDILGPRQWQWLEDTVAKYTSANAREDPTNPYSRPQCALTVIVSTLQVLLNDDKPNLGWDLYPFSRSRLLALLQRHEATRFLFVSGHAEVGELGLLRATNDDDRAKTGMIRHYEARTSIPSLTGHGAKLLPDASRVLVEVTSSGLTHAANEAAYVGWLYTTLVRPAVNENGVTDRYPYIPRRVYLDRTTVVERNFATVTLQLTEQGRRLLRGLTARPNGAPAPPMTIDYRVESKLGAALEVVIQIYSTQPRIENSVRLNRLRRRLTRDLSPEEKQAALATALLDDIKEELVRDDHARGADIARVPLVQRTLQLGELSSYAGCGERRTAVAPTGQYTASRTRDGIPIFHVYNGPGEYAPLKWYALYWNCEEAPCVRSSSFMIVKVISTLSLAGAILGIAITVMCCANWHQAKIKRWWRRVRLQKLKKE